MARDEEKYKAKKKRYREKYKEKIAKKRKLWGEKNKDKQAVNTRRYTLKKLYGITMEEYDAMYDAQAGCCAICNKYCEKGVAGRDGICVDHNHATGRVRALLCHGCNRGIGMVGEDTTILERMIAYIRMHNT